MSRDELFTDCPSSTAAALDLTSSVDFPVHVRCVRFLLHPS